MGRRMVPSTAFLAICAGDSGIWNTLDAPSLRPQWRVVASYPVECGAMALGVGEGCLLV
jgi:hypothetical protein